MLRFSRIWKSEAQIVTQPWLGLATTEELMLELKARGIIGQTLIDDQDKATLAYRTVDS